MNRTYELVTLLHPDLEIDVEAPIRKIEGIITGTGGHVIKRDNWGKKRLAYPIKHQDFAIYIYFEVELDPEQVRTVEAALLITEEVIRHILVVHEDEPSKPQAKATKVEDKPEGDQKEEE